MSARPSMDAPLTTDITIWTSIWFFFLFQSSKVVSYFSGLWFMHCHLGIETAFVIENGQGPDQFIQPPPKDLPPCQHLEPTIYTHTRLTQPIQNQTDERKAQGHIIQTGKKKISIIDEDLETMNELLINGIKYLKKQEYKKVKSCTLPHMAPLT